jgi:hypothetical protein
MYVVVSSVHLLSHTSPETSAIRCSTFEIMMMALNAKPTALSVYAGIGLMQGIIDDL